MRIKKNKFENKHSPFRTHPISQFALPPILIVRNRKIQHQNTLKKEFTLHNLLLHPTLYLHPITYLLESAPCCEIWDPMISTQHGVPGLQTGFDRHMGEGTSIIFLCYLHENVVITRAVNKPSYPDFHIN